MGFIGKRDESSCGTILAVFCFTGRKGGQKVKAHPARQKKMSGFKY